MLEFVVSVGIMVYFVSKNSLKISIWYGLELQDNKASESENVYKGNTEGWELEQEIITCSDFFNVKELLLYCNDTHIIFNGPLR